MSHCGRSQHFVNFSGLGDSQDKSREFDIETHEAVRSEKR
jgi:hypothetical protein